MDQQAHIAALQWYLDNGVDEALSDEPVNYYEQSAPPKVPAMPKKQAGTGPAQSQPISRETPPPLGAAPMLGASEARSEAVKLAKSAQNLEELEEAIADFEGIGLKKTATNLVFSDGNPKAKIMLIGEAPGADEDRQGKPFVGESGQMLDRIIECIGLSRTEDDPLKSIYISNLLNWRPPGNRTPAPGEIEVSMPFIERHIQIINPDILILCGGVPAKTLLGSGDGISKLRKKWHDYKPQTSELDQSRGMKAIATFHPTYLLRNPAQKKAVWADMLMIQKYRLEHNLASE